MKNFTGFIRILLTILLLLFFASCASKPDILGKWKEVGKVATLEFLPDGTFKAIDNQGMAVSGEYTLSMDGHLRCVIQHKEGTGEVVNLTVSIKGGELILTSPGDSRAERYGRAR